MDPLRNATSSPSSESASSWLRSAARAFGISDARSQSWIARGAIVDGRYHVVRPLGAGGMAVVLLAWDLELDRAVALKIYDHDVHDAARSRTHREARAMAALAHPNVTTIYGLGVHDARLYIAMEFVDGGTLGAWLRRERPVQQRVVELFVACANGLAAAHAAGIVHGDIKPSNLLVDLDGRPRVADFGLARPSRSDAPGAGGDASTASSGFFGTLRYAAPEQLAGAEIDARADQFSLCVTLYEALHGEHPFIGDDSEAVAAAIRIGARRSRRSGVLVPRGVARAIERGLSQVPTQRYPSMHELAGALRRGSWRRRVWWLLGGVAAAGVVVASVPRESGCGATESAMDEVWNDDRNAEISEAFASSDAPLFRELLDATTTTIDAWTDEWRSERREACAAMSTDADVGDARMRCLDRQRLALAAVIDALGHADRETVTRAPDVVARLRDPGACRVPDPSELAVPEDPELARQLDAEREQLARAHAALELGRHGESADLALGVVRRTAQDLPVLHAEASLALGLARSGAGEFDAADSALTDAFHDATAIGDDATAASAAIELVCVLPSVRGGNVRATRWLRTAAAIYRRRGTSEQDELRLELCRGGLLLADAQPRDAEQAYREALATTTTQTDPMLVARLHAGIGTALFDRGRFVESLAAYDRAVATVGAANRARRPDGLAIHVGRAEVLTRMGRAGDGLAAQLECLRDAIIALGRDAAALPKIYDGIAVSLIVLNAPSLAIAYAERGVEVARRQPSAGTAVPSLLSRLADSHHAVGGLEIGLGFSRGAISAAESAYGSDHPVTGKMIANHGVTLLGLERDDEGAEALARGLEIFRSRYGDSHPTIGLICLNFALMFQRREQLATADVYLAWAERVAAANQDARLEMGVMMWRGFAFMNAGELERSLAPLERAAQLAEHVDPQTQQRLLRDLGRVHLDRNDAAAAMDCFRRSHALAVAGEHFGQAATTALGMAKASWGLRDRDAARRFAIDALAMAETANDDDSIAEARAWLLAHGGRARPRAAVTSR